MDCVCNMKGYLTFLILWILKKKNMKGSQLAKELAKRKGVKPSPGTLYPALKDLNKLGLIKADKNKIYSLTQKGRKELKSGCKLFCCIFYDVEEILKVK